MAKKAQAPKAGGGGPQKACPQCKTKVHARTKVCPECKFEFPQSAAKAAGSSPKAAGRKASVDTEKLAMRFALFSAKGDIDKAIKAVEAYKEDDLASFIASAGGADKAVEALKALKGG